MTLFGKSCRDNVDAILKNGDRLDQALDLLAILEKKIDALTTEQAALHSALDMHSNPVSTGEETVESDTEPTGTELPKTAQVCLDAEPLKERKKHQTRYDKTAEFINSTQVYDWLKTDKRMGRKLTIGEINLKLYSYDLLERYPSGHGYSLSRLGEKTTWLIGDGVYCKNFAFRNNEEMKKYILMMFNNPRLFARYIAELKGERTI